MSFWDGVGAGDALRRAGFKGGHATRMPDYAISKRGRCKRFEAGREHVHVHADDTNQRVALTLKDNVEETFRGMPMSCMNFVINNMG